MDITKSWTSSPSIHTCFLYFGMLINFLETIHLIAIFGYTYFLNNQLYIDLNQISILYAAVSWFKGILLLCFVSKSCMKIFQVLLAFYVACHMVGHHPQKIREKISYHSVWGCRNSLCKHFDLYLADSSLLMLDFSKYTIFDIFQVFGPSFFQKLSLGIV